MAYRILIVDDHLVVRTGVAIVLKEQIPDLSISNAENFFETIAILKEQAFDLIILDINMPGGKKTEMIQEIRAVRPTVKILIFSAYEEEQYAFRYIISGANGYLNKLCSEEKMISAVTSVLETGKYIPIEIAHMIVEAGLAKTAINPLDTLSKRELEIAGLLVTGNGNLEISNRLNIHMSTVSTYKNRVFEKLKINNLVELINIYKNHVN
jgi:DNA-binding NarL/FixJ family response regulator